MRAFFASAIAILMLLPLSARISQAADPTVGSGEITAGTKAPTAEEICIKKLTMKGIQRGASLFLLRRCISTFNKDLELQKNMKEDALRKARSVDNVNTALARRARGFKNQLESHTSRRLLQGKAIFKHYPRYRARSRYEKTGTGSLTGTGSAVTR
ncbi:MAG: hypothetical protein AAB489_04780 [Patescibacteria group bacterium]